MDERKENARHLLALRQHWIYVVVAVALSVAGAAAYTQVAKKQYEASADVLVSPVGSDTLLGLPLLRVSLFGRSVVTAAQLSESPQVAARVRNSLNLNLAPPAVSALMTATPQQQSDIVRITGRAESPDVAARIANAFAQALLAERTQRFQRQLHKVVANLSGRLRAVGDRRGNAEADALAAQITNYRALYGDTDPTLEIASRAIAPSKPASPRPLLALTVAAMIGLLLGIGVAVGLGIASPVVMRAESISDRDGSPILARMPRPTDDDVRAALSDPHQLPHELRASVRTLWANLGALPNQSPGRILLITSAAAGEGSPAVAALLAAVVAGTGTSVTLIDADLEQGPLASMVDGEARSVPSLGRLLASDDMLAAELVHRQLDLRSCRPGSPGGRARKSAAPSAVLPLVSSQQLQMLLADPEDRQLTEWLPPERLSALVVQLRRQVKVVVVSAPPLPAAETTVLTNLADAVIITVAVGRTRRARLTRLREELAERGVVPAGFVVLERSSAQMRIAHLPSMPSVQRRSKLSVRRRWA